MTNTVTGSVINKVKFEIDSKSWQNLNKFQKRIADVKKQLAGLSGNIKVNAVVGQIEKVSRATGKAAKAQKDYNAHVVRYQKEMHKAHGQGISENARRNKGFLKSGTYGAADNNAHLVAYRKHLKEVEKMHGRALEMNKRFDNRTGSQRPVRTPQQKADDIRQQTSARLSGGGGSSRLTGSRLSQFDSRFAVLSSAYINGGVQLSVFRSQVNALTADLLRQERQAKSTAMGLGDIRSSLIQMTAAYTGFSVAANVFNTGKEFDSLTASMKLFAKDDAGVKAEMKFISDEAERLGINFQEAATQYTKFSIVARNKLSEEDRKGLFTGFSEYATVLQVDQYRFSRGMMAIQQMLSKSKISSEELRLQ